MMEFKGGTPVYTSDGKHIGAIDRLVLDPRNDEVIELIIRRGRLFAEDKILPIHLVETATEDRVTLRTSQQDLPELRKFEETHYVPAPKVDYRGENFANVEGYASASVYSYPPIGVAWWGYDSVSTPPATAEPEYRSRVEENIPEGMVAVKEGARVLSSEGEHVGHVDEVFTDEATHGVTHLVISKGILFKERKLIPTDWIKLLGEDDVMLTVRTEIIHHLPEYRG